MEIIKTFRHEYKYIIPYEDMLKLKEKFNKILTLDQNKDSYMVRSLYFDSVNDDDYYDKLGGEANRKKIRLRIYEPNSNYVKLELKSKYDIHQTKKSLIIDKNAAIDLIKGNYDILLNYNDKLAQEIYLILRSGSYKPKTIIEYNRTAYTSSTTTRITFDYDIRCSDEVDKFFDNDINYIDLTMKKDIVLEVKFDRFLEPYISSLLSEYQALNQSVSKYLMARNL